MWPDRGIMVSNLRAVVLLLVSAGTLFHTTECEQRSDCPEVYALYYCMNGGTCFSVTIDGYTSYNCACPSGWTGRRCELKDLPDDYYIKSQQRRVEAAGLAGGIAFLVLIIVSVTIGVIIYVRQRRKLKYRTMHPSECTSTSDRRPFSGTTSKSSSVSTSRLDKTDAIDKYDEKPENHVIPEKDSENNYEADRTYSSDHTSSDHRAYARNRSREEIASETVL